MLREFKEFAMRGNMVDLAIGVIIGGAFGKIIASLVGDILMPLIGLLLGKVSFVDLFVALDGNTYASLEEAKTAGAAVFAYGNFIQAVVDFLIVAFIIFLLIRAMNKMKKQEAPAPEPAPATKECPFCTMSVPVNAKRCPHCTSEL
jgi:large conductance mechanosensitive channel